MVTDPLAGLLCFVVAGGLALRPVLREKGRIRFAAAAILCIAILLAGATAPSAIKHYNQYTSRSAK